MNTLIIDKKEYVVIEKKECDNLLEKASLKKDVARKLSLSQGKKLAYSFIDNGTKENKYNGQCS